MLFNKFGVMRFFSELCALSIKYPGRSGYGIGCSLLIEDLIERNTPFYSKIENDLSGNFHEYRINGAGLKMHWRVVRKQEKHPTFECYISGDQVRDYPDFFVCAKELIRKWGANHR